MGRIIDLPLARSKSGASRASAGLTEEGLSTALLNGFTLRRQIGVLLEVIRKVEDLIDWSVDQHLHEMFLDQLQLSRQELLLSLESISTMLECLSAATAGEPTTIRHPVVELRKPL